MTMKQSFEEWFEELQRVAVVKFGFSKKAADFDEDCWRVYFDEGLTPSEALSEDLSYL